MDAPMTIAAIRPGETIATVGAASLLLKAPIRGDRTTIWRLSVSLPAGSEAEALLRIERAVREWREAIVAKVPA